MTIAPTFSVVVVLDSVEMSTLNWPGAPLVRVIVDLSCTSRVGAGI